MMGRNFALTALILLTQIDALCLCAQDVSQAKARKTIVITARLMEPMIQARQPALFDITIKNEGANSVPCPGNYFDAIDLYLWVEIESAESRDLFRVTARPSIGEVRLTNELKSGQEYRGTVVVWCDFGKQIFVWDAPGNYVMRFQWKEPGTDISHVSEPVQITVDEEDENNRNVRKGLTRIGAQMLQDPFSVLDDKLDMPARRAAEHAVQVQCIREFLVPRIYDEPHSPAITNDLMKLLKRFPDSRIAPYGACWAGLVRARQIVSAKKEPNLEWQVSTKTLLLEAAQLEAPRLKVLSAEMLAKMIAMEAGHDESVMNRLLAELVNSCEGQNDCVVFVQSVRKLLTQSLSIDQRP